MIPGLISNVPPFSSLQVQHVEGGFLCVAPPGAPVAAKNSGDVAAMLHIFLGVSELPSEVSSATDMPFDLQSAPIIFDWPMYVCPEGAVFNVSKIQRICNAKGKNRAYMLTYHAAQQGTAHQATAFNRATVMDRLKEWLLFDPNAELPEDGRVSMLATLSGMRPNPDMDLSGEAVFRIVVKHASQIEDFSGVTPYVAMSDEPALSIAIADNDLLHYIVDELNGDMEGEFAARIEDSWLEFGPRVEMDDDE